MFGVSNEHRFEGDTAAFPGALASMRAFMRAVGEACPATPILEVKSFHEKVFHRFRRISFDGSCLVRDDFAITVAKGVDVSEVEAF